MVIGGYVRLSRDEDKEDYASITAQKDIIKNYANSQGWTDIIFYEDDNYSGYKFNRPALNRMLEDVDNNKIDIIIAKDLSRIGRHNAHTLLLIENIKLSKKALIAIDDDYDSSKDNDDTIGIKTWFNERYVKDLSKKIRSNLNSKMRNNIYTNSLPYGYIKNNITHQIIIDEKAKPIVQKIFDMYLQGNGVLKIARYLNENNIPSPSEQSRLNAEEKGIIYKHVTQNKWRDGTIINILKNDFYIGIKRSKKTVRDGIHGKIVYLNENDHYVFKNNHEPIIDDQDFYLVQNIIEKRKNLNYRGETKHYNPYSGFLFCSDCGKLMIARSQKGRQKCYICSTYKRFKECTSHHIREESINNHIKTKICELKEILNSETLKRYTSVIDKIETEKNYESIIKNTNLSIFEYKQKHKILLSQKIKAIMKNPDMEDTIEKQYQELENDIFINIKKSEEQIIEFTKRKEQIKNTKKVEQTSNDVINSIITSNNFSKKNLELLIDRIIVYNDILEIKWVNPIKELIDAYENLINVDSSSTHRKTNVEQVNIIYINAITYLANMYEILKVQKVL